MKLTERILGAVAGVIAGIVCLYFLGVIPSRTDPDVARTRTELRAQRDSTAAWRARAAAAAAEATRLRADSARVYPLWAVSKEAATAGLWAVRAIAQQARERGDTTAATELEGAAVAIEGERAACSVVVLNCEKRAANAETARADAAQRVDSLARQLDSLGVKWEDAERRAKPSFLRDVWRARGAITPLLIFLIGERVIK